MSNATSTTTKKPPVAAAGEDGGARPAVSRPQLLSQIPQSIFASPGFIAGIAAVEFLYALVLFAVISSIKSERLIAWGPEIPVEAPHPEPAFVRRVVPKIEPKREQADAARAKSSAREESASANSKQQKQPGATEKPDAGAPVVALNTDREKPAPKKKKGARKKKQASKTDKTEVALNTKPAEPPPPPKEIPTIAPLGLLIDPLHLTQASADADGLTIKVSKGLFIFDARSKIETAPRAFTPVEGDFIAEVSIVGTMRSPTTPLKGLGLTFQGAGLLLWQDKDNYIRFERTAAYTGERLHRVMAESCKDGKQNKTDVRNIREGDVRLRLERRGNRLVYSYTLDGKTWLKLSSSNVSLTPGLLIGISASNASPKDFSARFEKFELKPLSGPG